MNYRFLEQFWRVKVTLRLIEVFAVTIVGWALAGVLLYIFVRMGGPFGTIVLTAGKEWLLEFWLLFLTVFVLYPWLGYKMMTSLDDKHEK